MRTIISVCLLLTQLAYAQHSEQPQKESTSDLRNQSVLFSIEDSSSKKTFWLERTQNMDYFLRMKESGGEDTIKKIDSKIAQKMDMDFASRFLKCQYEIESIAGDCKVTLRLMMKGESQEVCGKDEKKAQEMSPFVQDLGKRF